MKDITKAIQRASLTDWDEKIPDIAHWTTYDLWDSSKAIEKFRHTLYVHVMKNEKEYAIWDNNGRHYSTIIHPASYTGQKPKTVIEASSYMIKVGKSEGGIVSRRKLDFESHYHHRTGIRHSHALALSRTGRIHPRHPHLRIGSEGTILHLLIDLNKKDKTYIKNKEQELKEIFKSRFLGKPSYPGAEFIKMERINIPIASVRNERNFIEHVREVFERFEDTL